MTGQALMQEKQSTLANNQPQWVYKFGSKNTDGSAKMRNLLGGKGANLAEMCSLGLPVPPGFTITTALCTYFYENEKSYPKNLIDQVEKSIEEVEKQTETVFGSINNPLLLSIRSGARVSMPGMMDTVLNLGINDETINGLAKCSGDSRFAWDSYRRFIQMYGDVVLGVDHYMFEDIMDTYKRRENISKDTDITTENWQLIITEFKELVLQETGKAFPQDVNEQLWGAIGAVFQSWTIPRAITYRKLNNIPSDWGTAVNVQAMVFGNMGDDCATGVAFTRNPSTGDNHFYGEYLINAQGEDVVAGIRTPRHLTIKGKLENHSDMGSMEEVMPKMFNELNDIRGKLELHYKDMQDIEFTIQRGKLYMLQTRDGKRTTKAALKVAIDMVDEGIITKEQAIMRIAPESIDQLLHPTLDPKAEKNMLTKGLPASPGAASGEISFNADDAEQKAKSGHNVILCRTETSPEDIHGMYAAKGILTARGGMTSHAAVVARGMGRPCVAGAGEIIIDYKKQIMTIGDTILKAGDIVTIDGATGELFLGSIPTIKSELSDDFETLMVWADDIRTMDIRTNADTPHDATIAKNFGAEGIGLCRTEHMFFEPNRILNVRKMILSESDEERDEALALLAPEQQKDFAGIFRVMGELPVTIRLLDPPLHEFLPHGEKEIKALASALSRRVDEVTSRINRLKEENPMLGHRGCRLGISYPAIYKMQVKAIFAAATEVTAEGVNLPPLEIMVPLIATEAEFTIIKNMIDEIAKNYKISYMIGTMIELPRAALKADDIAKTAEFFSFGTNDLTQTTLGISRDDAGGFLPCYQELGIWNEDPFVSIDIDGVGELVKIGVTRGRTTNPNLKIGVCGEHGGDPASINFFQTIGLDYVSCSPYRVPVARLVAAQATLKK